MTDFTIDPPRFEADGVSSFYDPCDTGLHFCGQTCLSKNSQPYTALNIEAVTDIAARKLYEAAKAVAECEDDEADYIIDLQLSGDCNEDFSTNRQLLPKAFEAIKELSELIL